MSQLPDSPAIKPTVGKPGPTSTITIPSGESSAITIEYGVSVQITYDVTKLYIVGILQDKSKAMIATFSRETVNPFVPIQEWLEENFNPGPSAAAKTNRTCLLFLIWRPLSDESVPICREFIKMTNNITTFGLHSYGLIDSDHWQTPHMGIMSLNLSPEYPLIFGDSFHKMVNLPPKR